MLSIKQYERYFYLITLQVAKAAKEMSNHEMINTYIRQHEDFNTVDSLGNVRAFIESTSLMMSLSARLHSCFNRRGRHIFVIICSYAHSITCSVVVLRYISRLGECCTLSRCSCCTGKWEHSPRRNLNSRPLVYKTSALTPELRRRSFAGTSHVFFNPRLNIHCNLSI